MKKFLKIAVASFAIFCMGLLTSACSLFGGGKGKVTESEWLTAFEYDNKYVCTVNIKDTGDWYDAGSITVDGNKVKVVEQGFSDSLQQNYRNEYYYHFDGQYYWSYYNFNNDEWEKYQINEQSFNRYAKEYIFTAQDFSFEDFEYNSNKDSFVADDIMVEKLGRVYDISIKFENLKIKEILITTGETSRNFKLEFSYGNASVTLPQVGGEQPGQGGEEPGQGGEEPGQGTENAGQVTLNEWNSAFAYNGNLIMTQESAGVNITTWKYGNITKSEMSFGGVSQTAYAHFDGENYWVYTYYAQTETWYKQQVDLEEYSEFVANLSVNPFLFNDFAYNQASGSYEAENLQIDETLYNYVSIKFEDKKVAELQMTVDGYAVSINYDYETVFTLTLPENAIEGEPGQGGEQPGVAGAGQVSDAEWDNAFAYSGKYIMTNSMGAYGSIDAYIDGNTIKQVMSVMGYVEEMYMHFDGTNYWRYEQNDGVWARYALDPLDFEGMKLSALGSILDKTQFTYNSQLCAYECGQTDDFQSITAYFVDGMLARVDLESAPEEPGEESTIGVVIFDYTTDFTLTLPNIEEGGEQPGQGGEEPGVEVLSSEWQTAISSNEKRVLTQTIYSNSQTMTGIHYIYGDYIKSNAFLDDEEEYYLYFDGQNYWYYMIDGSTFAWKASYAEPDPQFAWQKQMFDTIARFISSINIILNNVDYSSFVFNDITGDYEAQNLEISYQGSSVVFDYVSVSFNSNKKLSKLAFEINGMENIITYSYEDFALTVPSFG